MTDKQPTYSEFFTIIGVQPKRIFHKHTKLTMLVLEVLLHETKDSNNKKVPPVWIEPGTYDFKSDTLFSELTQHLLVSLRLLYPYIVML